MAEFGWSIFMRLNPSTFNFQKYLCIRMFNLMLVVSCLEHIVLYNLGTKAGIEATRHKAGGINLRGNIILPLSSTYIFTSLKQIYVRDPYEI